MTRQDLIIATIRTAVPAAIGWLIAQAIAAVPAVADVIVTVDGILADLGVGATVSAILNALGIAVAVAGYYAAARWLGRRFPVLEKFLLGRSATPVYGGLSLTEQEADRQARIARDDAPKHAA